MQLVTKFTQYLFGVLRYSSSRKVVEKWRRNYEKVGRRKEQESGGKNF